MSEQLPPERVAAVDLGSNSFHMKVAHVVDGQLRVVDRMREMVRLAAGLDENDYLTEDTMGRAIDCLHRFGQGLRDVPPENVRVVGTNTLRRARNSGRVSDSGGEGARSHHRDNCRPRGSAAYLSRCRT